MGRLTAGQHVLAAATGAGPSWLWYATRGLGAATLVVLTCSIVVGIVTATRSTGRATPGFVAADLHRNFSLLGLGLLGAHIMTTVLDPFARIGLRDVIVPFEATYRPVWLGVGVAAAEVMLVVAATSLLRARIGARLWRLLHWTAYASWPLAVIHGLGTGSDARAPWLIGVVVSCVAAVMLALVRRLADGKPASQPFRDAVAIGMGLFLIGSTSWALQGPLQAGWATRAGTPAPDPAPVHPGPGGFSDPLAGIAVRDASGNVQISMRDTVDAAITIAIESAAPNQTLPVVTIARDSKVLCAVPATVAVDIYTVCNASRVSIVFFGPPSLAEAGGEHAISGRLDSSGPLR